MAEGSGHHAKKKSIHASEQERPDVKEQREQWMQTLTDACGGDFSRVLFLDETGAMTNLVRPYGRSAVGERCLANAPAGHWKTMTAVAAIRLGGLTASATMPHAMDGELFLVYVEQALLPALKTGDVVVMDNLPGHRLPKVRELVESTGAKLLYLPPYSPDFNPIEMIWSKVKRLLRSAAARTVQTLHLAFGRAMDAVTPDDILGCFRHCGYATTSGARL
jgi:transposase